VDFGRYGPNGDYYVIQNGEDETQSKIENPWPPTNAGNSPAIAADPYGLIYRWKVRQENGDSESPSPSNAR
jgi:hypothetical protein